MNPLRSLAFVLNAEKPGASELAAELITVARAAGVKCKRTTRFPIARGWLKGFDACCVIGGDGTLLGVAREAARAQVPVIGVNRGNLGFLTTFSAEEVRAQFPALLRGEFQLSLRTLLACSTRPGAHDVALNDVLVKDQLNSKLAHLGVFADGKLVTEYACDGLIFSTPTGSTAYNLSAGGPLIHPDAEVIAMTPICPHTLSNRSIIFRHDVRLRIYNRGPGSTLLVAMDGQRDHVSATGAPIEISIAPLRLPLVQRLDHAHFAVVRTKLHWSGGFVEKISPTSQ
jgi:NAD+ kinase